MNITELLSSPSMIHAAVVHMPIAAAFIGLIFVILSAIFHRNNTVRTLTALLFLIVVVSAYVAIETGEDARDLVPNDLPTAVWDQLSAHKAAAEYVLYAGVFTLACLLIALIRFEVFRIGGLLLAAVGAIATNIFCANTGHLGGALVYNHGVGTPLVHQSAPAVAAPTPSVPTEPTPAPVMPSDAVVPPVVVEPVPIPLEPVPTPAPVETPPVEPMPDPVAENPEWLPIREFTMEEAALVSFKRDVWPIIDDQCVSCHENPDADGEYDMTTVENMAKGGKKGGLGIVPGKPDESSIIHYIRGIAKPRMPEDEDPLSDEQIHTLRMWIAAGAKDDSLEPEAVVAPAEPVTEAAPVSEAVPAPESAPAPEAVPTPEATPAPVVIPEPAPAPEATPVPEATQTPVETPAEATI